MTVYPFSQFQVAFLRGLFLQETAAGRFKVLKVARIDNGTMIVEYEAYGTIQVESVPADATYDSYVLDKL